MTLINLVTNCIFLYQVVFSIAFTCFRHIYLLLYLVRGNECPVDDEDDHNITYDNPIDKDDLNSFEHPILESDHNNRNEGDEDSNECPFGEDIRKDDNNMV